MVGWKIFFYLSLVVHIDNDQSNQQKCFTKIRQQNSEPEEKIKDSCEELCLAWGGSNKGPLTGTSPQFLKDLFGDMPAKMKLLQSESYWDHFVRKLYGYVKGSKFKIFKIRENMKVQGQYIVAIKGWGDIQSGRKPRTWILNKAFGEILCFSPVFWAPY